MSDSDISISAADMEHEAETYVKLRNFKEKYESEMKANVAKVKAEMDRIEGKMMTFLNNTGLESANTKSGTFFKRTTTSCKVSDWDSTLPFIQEHGLWNMLEQRVSNTAVAEYIELNKEVPPGLSITREVAISVNRPKIRS